MRAGLKLCRRNPQTAASEGGGKEPSCHLMQGEAHRNQSDRCDPGDSGSQTVQSIQPVDRIGDPHQPDHRRQKAEAIGEHDR